MDRIEIIIDQRQRIIHKISVCFCLVFLIVLGILIAVFALFMVLAAFAEKSLVFALLGLVMVPAMYGILQIRFTKNIANGEMASIDVNEKVIHVVKEGFRHLVCEQITFQKLEHLECFFIQGRANATIPFEAQKVSVSSYLFSFYAIFATIDDQLRLVTCTPNRQNFNRIVESIEFHFSPTVNYEELKTYRHSLNTTSSFKSNYYTFSNTWYNYKYSPNHHLFSLIGSLGIFIILTVATVNDAQSSWFSWLPHLILLIAALYSCKKFLECRKEYKNLRQRMDTQNPPRSLPFN